MTIDARNDLEQEGMTDLRDLDPATWPDPDGGELEAIMLGPSRVLSLRFRETAE